MPEPLPGAKIGVEVFGMATQTQEQVLDRTEAIAEAMALRRQLVSPRHG